MKTEDFQFEALLGEGTFGKVYLVLRRKDARQLVVKVQKENSTSAWFNKVISAEVECLQTLRHPNIISYYGAWRESGSFFILMEYAARGTLKDLLDSRAKPLEEKDSLYLFAQILLGVHHIHGKKILHRDLKPENIMLTGRMGDVVKIGDFGLSRDLQANNPSHAGSYYYIAPEMLKKEGYDMPSDIWSMGVILYEMLTQELTFPASSLGEVIEMICSESLRIAPLKIVSRSTRIIVLKMLRKSPAKRPTTRHLLIHPSLLSHIARVYLNLGRAYATPSESFGFDVFQPFLQSS